MAAIRYPLTGGKGWKEVSLYKEYADKARENIKQEHFFEAILVCSVGLGVLLNTLPDRILLFNSKKLDDLQEKALETIRRGRLTAGKIIKKFDKAEILHRRLVNALNDLVSERNKIVHPMEGGELKEKAIIPSQAAKEDACKFYRKFCHIINLAGGRSPLSEERDVNQYISERRSTFKRHFSKA